MRLQGKIALITGAAQGQGGAEARRFVAEGATVYLVDVVDDLGQSLAAELGDEAFYEHLDVSQVTDWQRVIDVVRQRHGRLDILVNNAGIGVPAHHTEDSNEDDHRRTLDVNMNGVYYGMRAAYPLMKASGGGSIVNISSIDGLVGVAYMASYIASKFAVTGLTRSLALEWGVDNIRVNSVHPGVISSPMVEKASPEIRARLDTLMEQQPIKRMGTPEEVANLVLFLASDESSYCTGAQFVIDGGHLAGPYRNDPYGG